MSAAARQQQQQGVHPVRWSGGVVLFLRIMGPSDDPVLLGLDIVKEGRPLPQDEVRMFLASVQSRPRARGGNITTTTKHSSPNKKKHSAK